MNSIKNVREFANPTLNIAKLKQEFRQKYKEIRNSKHLDLENDLIKKEKELAIIESKLTNLINIVYVKYKEVNIACYVPIHSEIDCFSMIKNIKVNMLKTKNFEFKISLPIVTKNQSHLNFFEYTSDNELVEGRFGIKEPERNNSRELIPNVIITPLLTFDEFKNRIGYGRGYYDQTFRHMRELNISFYKVGIAYDEQLCEEILPVGEFDQKLDYIITPNYNL